jgi:hypothetical protein
MNDCREWHVIQHYSLHEEGMSQFAPLGLVRKAGEIAFRVVAGGRDVVRGIGDCGEPVRVVSSLSSVFLERAMGIELHPKFLSLTEPSCYQLLREPIVAKARCWPLVYAWMLLGCIAVRPSKRLKSVILSVTT